MQKNSRPITAVPTTSAQRETAGVLARQDMLRQLIRCHRVRRIFDVNGRGWSALQPLLANGDIEYIVLETAAPTSDPSAPATPHPKIPTPWENGLDATLLPPDLIICFDLLEHITNAKTYRRILSYLFNSGAKALLLTAAVAPNKSVNGRGASDFWHMAKPLTLRYERKVERLHPQPHHRLLAFELVEPAHRGQQTEIAYVCTSDRQQQLFTSLRTLLLSGTIFDRVVIFLLDKRPSHWQFRDPRIIIKEVEPLIPDFFFSNKAHICARQTERIIHMDTDTLILRPLDLIWESHTEDFLARPASAIEETRWMPKIWQATQAELASRDVPMFNSGFMVFQNGSHHQVEESWLSLIRKYMEQDLPTPGELPRMYGQLAVSLAVGTSKLSFAAMSAIEHAYAWTHDTLETAHVFHTGNWLFNNYVKQATTALLLPDNVGIPHPDRKIPAPNRPSYWVRARNKLNRHLWQWLAGRNR